MPPIFRLGRKTARELWFMCPQFLPARHPVPQPEGLAVFFRILNLFSGSSGSVIFSTKPPQTQQQKGFGSQKQLPEPRCG